MKSRFWLFASLLSFVLGVLLATVVISRAPGLLGLEDRSKGVEHETAILTWKNLERVNTTEFAANLRAIGCPEATIRRIVTLPDDAATPAGAPLAAPVPAEAPVLAVAPAPLLPTPVEPALPVPTPQAVPPSAPVVPRGPDVVIVAPEGSVPLPVAFQPTTWDADLTPEQQAKLNAIQEEFIKAIGGTYHDPTSSHYKDRWREAQRRSDEQFKEAFGIAAFISRQMAMARANQAARTQP
jgi:hypothetical protein